VSSAALFIFFPVANFSKAEELSALAFCVAAVTTRFVRSKFTVSVMVLKPAMASQHSKICASIPIFGYLLGS
jgi:hypothetical protein